MLYFHLVWLIQQVIMYMWPAKAPVSTEIISYELFSASCLLWQTPTWRTSGWSSTNLMKKKKYMRQILTYGNEKPLEFPMLVGHNLQFQWTLDKQNEVMNWCKGSLMSMSNMYCTFKSLSKGRSDSVKEHLALGMKQLGSENTLRNIGGQNAVTCKTTYLMALLCFLWCWSMLGKSLSRCLVTDDFWMLRTWCCSGIQDHKTAIF